MLRDALTLIAPSEGQRVLTAVVELHRPVPCHAAHGSVFWECEGCDRGDYAEGAPDAPCTTLNKVAKMLGVAL